MGRRTFRRVQIRQQGWHFYFNFQVNVPTITLTGKGAFRTNFSLRFPITYVRYDPRAYEKRQGCSDLSVREFGMTKNNQKFKKTGCS